MASGDRTIKITIVGNADSAQNALKQTADSATQAEVKVEGFGKSFVRMGAALGVGQMVVEGIANAMTGAVSAVGDYNKSIDLAERQLRGMLGSQEAATEALAVAREEADKGRGTYQELAGAMAGLSSVAKTAGMDLQSVTEIAEILAAVNPAEGISGATFALREAATGDMTSVIERFNLSRTTINKLRAEGVPAIEAVRRAMQEMGYDTQFLNEVNASSAKQSELLKGRLTELAAIGGEPIFEVLNKSAERLLATLQSPAGATFMDDVAKKLEEILSGNLLNSLGTSLAEVWYIAGAAFNDFIKSVTFDKLNIDEPLRRMRANIESFRAGWQADVDSTFAEPVAKALSGDGGGALAPERVKGYGAEVLRNYVAGFDSSQLGALGGFDKIISDMFKGNEAGATGARAALAAAIGEIEQFGRISDGTFGASEGVLGEYVTTAGQVSNTTAEITRIFGAQAPEVLRLLQLYTQQSQAQDQAAVSAAQLATANDQLVAAQQRAADVAERQAAAVAHAQAVAANHANQTAAAVAAVEAQIAGVQRAAEDQARASAAAVDALNDDLSALQDRAQANAAAAQAAQTRAQEELTAIQERRRESAEALYNELVDGERRALDAANNRVNQLSRQANKEDLTLLKQIQAARDAGNTKEAARLTRQLDAQRKRRQGAMEIARAEAAVAKDEFDAADERADKEVERQDKKLAAEEEAAKARLEAIQTQAKEQAAADQAAIRAKQDEIKAAQDIQKQNAQNAADRQRQLRDEIAGIEERARKQAAEDELRIKTLKAAQFLNTTMANEGVTRAQTLVTAVRDQATAMERQRDAARELFELEQRRIQLYRENGLLPGQVPASPLPNGGAPNPTIGPTAGTEGARRVWDDIVRGAA